MEALVLILAELIAAPAAAAVSVIGELLATLLSIVFELLFGWIGVAGGKQSERQVVTDRSVQRSRVHLVLRKIRTGLLLLAAGIIIGLVLINYVFLNEVVSWTTQRIAQHSGIRIRYAHFQGDLFTGKFAFKQLHVSRDTNPYLNFDIKVKALQIDMHMLSNPFSEVQLNSVRLNGVSGGIHRIKARQSYRERRSFVANSLAIQDADLEYTDASNPQRQQNLQLNIRDWSSSPMRSRFALFDLLFRSNAHGKIDGHVFAIETSGDQSRRKTSWRVNNAPVETLRAFVGGPIALLQSGTVDVRVDDSWDLNGSPDIRSNWHFIFKQLKAAVPENYAGLRRRFAQHLVEYLNSRPPQFDLGFSLTMNKKVFRGKTTLEAAGLWHLMLENMVKELARLSGQKQQLIKGGIQRGIGALRHYLDERRKTAADSPPAR